MAIYRYWRLVGLATDGNDQLELSEARLYEGGVLADAGAVLTATISPSSGALSDLRDGVATGVVTWPYASYSTPGFALVWDFGVGAGCEYGVLQIGSGASSKTAVRDVTVQYSSDGVGWRTSTRYASVVFGANYSLTPTPSAVTEPGDEYYELTVGLLLGNGVNGATGASAFSDASYKGASVGPYAGATTPSISTAQSKFGGAAIYFDGVAGKSLAFTGTGGNVGLNLQGSFTIEAWVYPLNFSAVRNIFGSRWVGTGGEGYQCSISTLGKVTVASCTSSASLVLNAWQHVAFVRQGTTDSLYFDGVLVATGTSTSLTNWLTHLAIGSQYTSSGNTPLNPFVGYIDDFRATNQARYAANFTPPSFQSPLSAYLTTNGVMTQSGAVSKKLAPTPERLLPATTLPVTTATGHLREYPFFDAYNGGSGTVAGTVKEKNTPANTPLARRVLLIEEASRMTIRETWSDAVTGAFEFRGVKQGVKYSTISYDHLHNYRAVIADNQDAT